MTSTQTAQKYRPGQRVRLIVSDGDGTRVAHVYGTVIGAEPFGVLGYEIYLDGASRTRFTPAGLLEPVEENGR